MAEPPPKTAETPEALYGILAAKKALLAKGRIHALDSWMGAMRNYLDPNACSCQKTKSHYDSLKTAMYRLPDNLSDEHKEYIRTVIGHKIMLLTDGKDYATLA